MTKYLSGLGGQYAFFEFLDNKDYGIMFSGCTGSEFFLDLTILIHFKSTDGNGHIPVSSCHQPRWVVNVPKGQFTCIMRNCSKLSDYIEQSNMIKQRFIDKGYDAEEFEKMVSSTI